SGAVIDGDSLHRLFTIDNASLHLSNLNISSGASVVGGAIAAEGSTLTFDRTNFLGNTASGYGGAVYDGGGVCVSEGSSLSWDFPTGFYSNSAEVGGAVAVPSNSSASWSAVTTYLSNVAVIGGALATFGTSTTYWNASTTFLRNEALRGGAVAVHESSLGWSGEGTGFHGNRAADIAGGISLSSSSLSAVNSTFSDNSAVHSGGVMHIHGGSSVVF
ncbi:unnamed protein product, partial [Scytosiphon promiscuus]